MFCLQFEVHSALSAEYHTDKRSADVILIGYCLLSHTVFSVLEDGSNLSVGEFVIAVTFSE